MMKKGNGSRAIRDSRGDRIFNCVNNVLLSVFLVMVLYPVIYVVSSSLSSAAAVANGKVFFLPVGITLQGYRQVIAYHDIWTGYGNTILYTVCYTLLGLGLTILAAYPLSRKDLFLRNPLSFLFAFTMWFSGGLVPNYLLVRSLGLLDSRLAVILPGALSVYNIIIMRTFFQTNIPDELLESAKLDGCSDWNFLIKIVLPLSKAVLIVIAMFYAVGMWNSYMGAFIYLSTRSKYPLQIILREILIMSQQSSLSSDQSGAAMLNADERNQLLYLYEVIKYVIIVVSTLPLVTAYPFLQRYFLKGVMLGAIKG
jgi:putative aldouronate transport system permease protein